METVPCPCRAVGGGNWALDEHQGQGHQVDEPYFQPCVCAGSYPGLAALFRSYLQMTFLSLAQWAGSSGSRILHRSQRGSSSACGF